MKSAVFDLDGTLIHSLPGIQHSAHVAIAKVVPGLGAPDLSSVIGPPIRVMFQSLWPHLQPVVIDALVNEFRAHYLSEGCLLSVVYPEVFETLSKLKVAGLSMFVLTNKPTAPTKKILDYLGLATFFNATLSPDSPNSPFRTKVEGALSMMDRFGLVSRQTVLVGDGTDDLEAASACGFPFIAAAYGYGSAASLSVTRAEKVSDIASFLL